MRLHDRRARARIDFVCVEQVAAEREHDVLVQTVVTVGAALVREHDELRTCAGRVFASFGKQRPQVVQSTFEEKIRGVSEGAPRAPLTCARAEKWFNTQLESSGGAKVRNSETCC